MAKKVTTKKSKLTKDGFEHISIWQANAGDLVCYLTSQKIYLVAGKEGHYVQMVSATQQFKAITSFDVKRVLRATEVNDANYNALLEKLPSNKNVSLTDLQRIGEEFSRKGKVSATTLKSILPAVIEAPAPKEEIAPVSYDYSLPEGWDRDGWFDSIQNREFRTEKEVETKFILPFLARLGYTDNDRYDAMLVEGADGSRKISLEIDFAMFASDTEELSRQVILIVEAKKEHRLVKQTEMEKAQRQAKSYSIWTGCKFGLITDSQTIQVLDIMPNTGSFKVLFECQRSELKERFLELYNIVGKERLKEYYLQLI